MSHFSQMTDAQLKNMLLRLNNCADASRIAQAPKLISELIQEYSYRIADAIGTIDATSAPLIYVTLSSYKDEIENIFPDVSKDAGYINAITSRRTVVINKDELTRQFHKNESEDKES